MKDIFFTVAVAVFRNGKLKDKCLRSIIKQEKDAFQYEIIAVYNNRDESNFVGFKREAVTLSSDIRVFYEKKEGLSYARNRVVREAKGRYIAFIDDDAYADKRWLKEAYLFLKQYKFSPVIFGGPVEAVYKNGAYPWYGREHDGLEFSPAVKVLKNTEYLSGPNFFVSRKLFNKIGLFNTGMGVKSSKLALGEETELMHRARKREKIGIYYVQTVKVFHYIFPEKTSFSYKIKRFYEGGIAMGVISVMHGRIFRSFYLAVKFISALLFIPLYFTFRLIVFGGRKKTIFGGFAYFYYALGFLKGLLIGKIKNNE